MFIKFLGIVDNTRTTAPWAWGTGLPPPVKEKSLNFLYL